MTRGEATQRPVTVRLVGTAPDRLQGTVRAQAPGGLTVEPSERSFDIDSDSLPTEATAEFTVSVPPGTPEGEYPVTFTARGRAGAGRRPGGGVDHAARRPAAARVRAHAAAGRVTAVAVRVVIAALAFALAPG